MNLLELINNGVYETELTRKITINGSTQAYKVYRIDPSLLFYNNNNDRIATWINQYEHSNSTKLADLDLEAYNRVIEKFVYGSNPVALERTKKNIELVNQREAGVVLPDGRIIDGNRRFTCIRMINRANEEKMFFEAVILPFSIENDYKQIKLLELSIQHGEEQKVDYNPLDKLLGMYLDIVVNKAITIDEYSASTNETANSIRRDLTVASFINDYLAFIHAENKYYLARDMQIVSPLSDLAEFIKRIKSVEKQEQIKQAVFSAIFLNTTGDFRRYIKDLTSIITSGAESIYLNEQERLKNILLERLEDTNFNNINEIKSFVESSQDLANEMSESFDLWLNKSHKKIVLSRPTEYLSKAKTNIDSIDPKIIEKMDEVSKEKLSKQLHQVIEASKRYLKVTDANNEQVKDNQKEQSEFAGLKMALPNYDEPVFIVNNHSPITGMINPVIIHVLSRNGNYNYDVCFVDKDNNVISDTIVLNSQTSIKDTYVFTLSKTPSNDSAVYLRFIKQGNKENEISQLVAFKLAILFSSDIGF